MYIPKCLWSPWDARRTRWAIVEVGKDRSAAAIIPHFAHTLSAPAYKARIPVTRKNALNATINAWREKDLRTVLAAHKQKCAMLGLNAPTALQLELIRQAPVRQGGEALTEIDLDIRRVNGNRSSTLNASLIASRARSAASMSFSKRKSKTRRRSKSASGVRQNGPPTFFLDIYSSWVIH